MVRALAGDSTITRLAPRRIGARAVAGTSLAAVEARVPFDVRAAVPALVVLEVTGRFRVVVVPPAVPVFPDVARVVRFVVVFSSFVAIGSLRCHGSRDRGDDDCLGCTARATSRWLVA